MPVIVTRNFAPLSKTKLTDKELMREVGLLARELIVTRTIAGRDENDASFTPYSPGYAKYKTKELGLSAAVNLQVSGAMLNAITIVEVTDTSVELGFSA